MWLYLVPNLGVNRLDDTDKALYTHLQWFRQEIFASSRQDSHQLFKWLEGLRHIKRNLQIAEVMQVTDVRCIVMGVEPANPSYI